ncbi:hypothetical protein ACN38_g1096 [Penicillium nordicum]|uniref:Uncharacterized protein n=1 Tax=Penicillium nordicum TaxID=229535 RepID=A0A0N0RZZ1_9EURO|nr:hypothetical protein ACN38_g1096 [Penicillium nordicum]
MLYRYLTTLSNELLGKVLWKEKAKQETSCFKRVKSNSHRIGPFTSVSQAISKKEKCRSIWPILIFYRGLRHIPRITVLPAENQGQCVIWKNITNFCFSWGESEDIHTRFGISAQPDPLKKEKHIPTHVLLWICTWTQVHSKL